MNKALPIVLITLLISTSIFAQTWTKITSIADTVNIKAVAQIKDRILISGTLKGAVTNYHFSSANGNTDWAKLPTFDYAGEYLFGLPQNEILLGGGFLGSKKLTQNTWTTNFSASGFAEFPDGTIIGGSGNYPDSIYTFSSNGTKGKTIGKFKFKFGPKYSIGNSNRLFLYSYGSGFAYIDQADKSKLIFPALLDGAAMTETSWNYQIISDLAKLSDGTLIATNKVNTIIRSVDNGNSWTTVLNKNSAVGLAVEVNSKDEIFVIFEDQVLKSTDRGFTYSNISFNLPAFKADLFINNNDELFIICNSNGQAVQPTKSGIFKYSDNITSVLATNTTKPMLLFFPNPTENSIELIINDNFELADFTLYSAYMQKIMDFTITPNSTKIDLNMLPNGIYFAQIVINGQSKIQKIIKQ